MTFSFNTVKSAFDTVRKELSESDSNVSNMLTPGYNRHTTLLKAQIGSKGKVVGVQVSQVRREIDQKLFNRYQNANSKSEFLKVQSKYLENLQSSFGLFGREDDMAKELVDVFNAFDKAATEPENASLAKIALDKLSNLTLQINQTADRVQESRLNADRDIFESVKIVNGLLQQYHNTNDSIVHAKARGHDPIDLQSERDHLFFQISTYLPVTEAPQDTGRNWLYLKGSLLVKNEDAAQLDFTSVSYITPESTRDNAATGLKDLYGIKIGTSDITDFLDAGKLAGLFQMRDVLLPDIQAQLDEFAVGFRDQLNAHHNTGTAFQAPQTLTGNQLFASSGDTLNLTGMLRVAVVTPDQKFAGYKDIDLSTTTTVGALTGAISSGGNAGKITASLQPSLYDPTKKVLQIQANDPKNGVAIVSPDAALPDKETTTGLGVSQFIGLNDMLLSDDKFVGGKKIGVANILSVSGVLLQSPSGYAHGTLDTTAVPVLAGSANETRALTSGSNSNSQSIANSINELWNFSVAGGIVAGKDTLKNYAIKVIQINAQNTSTMENNFTSKNNVFLNLKESVAQISGVSQEEEVLNRLQFSEFNNLCAAVFKNLREVNNTFTKLMLG